jgi:anti-sigma B factor antagonist
MTSVLADRTVRRIEMDFAAVTFMDSTGIAALIDAQRRAAAAAAEFIVIGCQPRVLRILEITGLDKILTGRQSEGP